MIFVDSLAIPTSPNIVNVFVSEKKLRTQIIACGCNRLVEIRISPFSLATVFRNVVFTYYTGASQIWQDTSKLANSL